MKHWHEKNWADLTHNIEVQIACMQPVTVHNIEIICMYISEGRSIYFRVCTCNKYYYKMGKIVIDLMLKN